MDRNEILQKLQNTDIDKVKAYLEALDRMVLQSLVAKLMEDTDVEAIIKYWREQVKSEINLESGARNDFLMATPLGRVMSATNDVEDGESLRLSCVKAMELASEIAKYNYLRDDGLSNH